MVPCQRPGGMILNKGCVFSPVPFTVSGRQPPVALLLDPAQLGTTRRTHPPDGGHRVSLASGNLGCS